MSATIIRARSGAFGLRTSGLPGSGTAADSEGNGMPTMFGHFAVWNQWTEIDSIFEGHFMERLTPNAFDRTFAEDRSALRVLFQHGKDPYVGSKPLGSIRTLRADAMGAFAEVPLLDASYVRDIVPGIEAGQYGQSFRFRVTREEVVDKPERSDYNPEGLPERTIKELRLFEFGPVTFPAYPGTDVGVRSLTDWYEAA